ncbi:Hypp1234 [Branchiostoma lanceolatum]|uniref:Hypp1234 protein n=1 Tax=Branchiostoma lanceolatum TaxID=7740 RepID=A0A8J9ZGX2_BRALA|nr:Hypp1234 [Branchiostoma lanceolatum]
MGQLLYILFSTVCLQAVAMARPRLPSVGSCVFKEPWMEPARIGSLMGLTARRHGCKSFLPAEQFSQLVKLGR